MEKILRFEANIQNVEKINPLFSKARIRVLYPGINRNNTNISKEAIEEAIPSLYNIPIVGEYLEEKDNFGSHGGKIEITEDDIKFVQTTKPYGVVAESAKIYWENITENDGTVHEYLVIDGAYLWTGRYSELENLLERPYGQSMEIEIIDGEFAIINGQKVFDIKKFVFSALCILGVDKNGEGHVEPAFESASIVAYTFDKEEFKKEFNQMIAELKFSLNVEGGINMPKEEIKTDVHDVQVENGVDDQESEVVETEEEKKESVDYEKEYTKLKEEYDVLKKKYDALESEVNDLRDYKAKVEAEKRETAEKELFERFSAELTEEEMKELKENASKFSIQELEDKLFALLGKKKANFAKQQSKVEKQTSVKVEVEKINDEKNLPYGGIFEKYLS